MLAESDLRELLDFSAVEPVLSLYLNTDPTLGNADFYRLRLRNMLKEVSLAEDVSAVEQFFNREYQWTGRGVAVFSCAPRGFFRAYFLAVPLPDQVFTSDRPVVKPLAQVLDAFGGYGVVLVDKQGARLFHFHLGELREQEGVVGEVVKHTKRGGASAVPGRRGGTAGMTRHEDEVIERNLKDCVEFSTHFFEENHIRRILIGGSDDNIALFRSFLPKAWQSLVVGTFPMGMASSHSEVMAKAMQTGMEAELHREARQVDTVINAAARGSGGVVGLEHTLNALRDGRVQTLLVHEGYHEPGFRCKGCGALTVVGLEKCAFCGEGLEKIPDGVELAVRAVMKAGGEVDIVHANPIFERAGKIGAILRY
jgi:peptide chain release factor subunit 1